MKDLSLKVVLEVLIIIMVFSAIGLKFLDITAPVEQPLIAVQASPTPGPIRDVPYERTVEGEYTCLPHKNTNGPRTLECALGLKLEDGTHISLDFTKQMQSGKGMDYATGDKLQVRGTFVPIEQISTDQWQKYDITGILSVDEVTKL